MNADLFDRLRLFRGGGGNDGSGNRRSGSRSPTDPDRSRCKRALFGPVDHDANLRFVQQELAKSQREMSDRYNFDFETDQPREGRFKWERFGVRSTVETSTTSANVSETDEQKENSRVYISSNPATTAPTTTTATTTTTTNSLVTCDNTTPSETAATAAASASSSNTSCKSSNSSQKPSVAARHSNRKTITGHFQQRKRSRSKSKVKTQERKPENERDLSPQLSAGPTAEKVD
jgi:hypothetical protein